MDYEAGDKYRKSCSSFIQFSFNVSIHNIIGSSKSHNLNSRIQFYNVLDAGNVQA